MASRTVRIDPETLEVLRQLAEELGESMPKVLSKAVEVYRRQQVLGRANTGYANLRSDPLEWQEERAERRAWEVSLADGLDEP